MSPSLTPPKARKKSALAPLAPLFTALNWVAFVGWTYVLFRLALLLITTSSSSRAQSEALGALQPVVLGLECICLIEVVRIVLGDLPGNVVLGVVLHAIRFTVLTVVLASDKKDDDDSGSALSPSWLQQAIFLSWAVTEVSRYPMYMFSGNAAVRNVRMVVPLCTFPVGAAAEGYATYLVLWQQLQSSSSSGIQLWQQALLVAVLFVNGVLGPTVAYPALLKKGLPVLGLTKKKKSTAKKKE